MLLSLVLLVVGFVGFFFRDVVTLNTLLELVYSPRWHRTREEDENSIIRLSRQVSFERANLLLRGSRS